MDPANSSVPRSGMGWPANALPAAWSSGTRPVDDGSDRLTYPEAPARSRLRLDCWLLIEFLRTSDAPRVTPTMVRLETPQHPTRSMTADPDFGRVFGLIITFRRPELLRETVDMLMEQTKVPDVLLIYDNSPEPLPPGWIGNTRCRVIYRHDPTNPGPAGAMAAAMHQLMQEAEDRDWLLRLDDDLPTRQAETLETLYDRASLWRAEDPTVAAVGLAGARFDASRARLIRPDSDSLVGAVEVDYLSTNNWPLYSMAAIARAGVFDPAYFFGFEELEYGLRLRAGGWRVVADGGLWSNHGRRSSERAGIHLGITEFQWRRYYSRRNLIQIERTYGSRRGMATAIPESHGKASIVVASCTATSCRAPPVERARHLRRHTRADGKDDRPRVILSSHQHTFSCPESGAQVETRERGVMTSGRRASSQLAITLYANSVSSYGGAAKSLVQLANHLAEASHRVTVVTMDHSLRPASRTIDPRVVILRLGVTAKSRTWVARVRNLGRRYRTIRRARRSTRPDLVISFGCWTNVLVILANMGWPPGDRVRKGTSLVALQWPLGGQCSADSPTHSLRTSSALATTQLTISVGVSAARRP